MLTLTCSIAEAGGYVRGYYRQNGTYVAPYYRGGSGTGSSVASTSTGKPCGNAFISAEKTCNIGTTIYKASDFRDCEEANANGIADIPRNSVAYTSQLDRDGDGIACESNGKDATSIVTLALPEAPAATGTAATQQSGTVTVVNNRKVAMFGGVCPTFKLSSSSIEVTIPAQFPNPERKEYVDHLECGGFILDIAAGYSAYRQVFIGAPTWQAAWALAISKEHYLRLDLDVDTTVRLELVNGVASTYSEFQTLTPRKTAVIALSANGGALQPVLFDGKTTPQQLQDGVNRFYQSAAPPYGNYQLIEVDTKRNTVTFIPTAKMPAQ